MKVELMSIFCLEKFDLKKIILEVTNVIFPK